MLKILVPVDGSECALRAVQDAIRMAQHARSGAEILALNVQVPIVTGHARMFLDKSDIQTYYDTESQHALDPARPLLETSDVPFRMETRIGPTAETIAEYATEKGCDRIVMGTRGLGTVSGMLLGSVATKVIHLSNLPVTLVK